MRLTWLAAAGIGCLLLAGCATGVPRNTAGQVTAKASIDAFQITVGDCTGAMKKGDVASLQVIPCDQPHYFEAYARTDLNDGDFPGEEKITKQANAFCAQQFKTFIGVSTKNSAYDMFYLFPVDTSWATGDREVLCLVGSTSGKVTGTLKGIEK